MLPEEAEHWSLTKLQEKLITIGAKVVPHGRCVSIQPTEVASPRACLFRASGELTDCDLLHSCRDEIWSRIIQMKTAPIRYRITPSYDEFFTTRLFNC